MIDDQDIQLIAQYQQEQQTTQVSIKKLEGMMFVLLKSIELMIGSDKYWAAEARRHIKYAALSMTASVSTPPTANTLMLLKEQYAKNQASNSVPDFQQPTGDVVPLHPEKVEEKPDATIVPV